MNTTKIYATLAVTPTILPLSDFIFTLRTCESKNYFQYLNSTPSAKDKFLTNIHNSIREDFILALASNHIKECKYSTNILLPVITFFKTDFLDFFLCEVVNHLATTNNFYPFTLIISKEVYYNTYLENYKDEFKELNDVDLSNELAKLFINHLRYWLSYEEFIFLKILKGNTDETKENIKVEIVI